MAQSAYEKGLELLLFFDEKSVPTWIGGDVTRIRQIIVNLLSNGVKFTNKGEITITVQGDESNQIHFAVKDTGIGIPKDRMHKLFQSFSQVDSSTTRQFGGTGLGLAISKQLCELMGGKMWVESELNCGSTFHFTIAANPVNAKDIPTNSKSDPISPSLLQHKKALIIDDNAANRQLLAHFCQRWQMPYELLSSAEEGIGFFQNGNSTDVILLDFQMPNMNGLQMVAQLKKNGVQLPPIILISSIHSTELKIEADRLGIDLFLRKPIKISHLLNSILPIFSEKKGASVQIQKEKILFDESMAQKFPLKILLAEDNLINQKVASRTLERLGYQIDVVANGQEAVASTMRQSYDLILMDVHMPVMDGLKATRLIQSMLPSAEQPTIVALTAGVMEQDKEKCLQAGMAAFLTKPFKVQDLIDTFIVVFEKSEQQKSMSKSS